MAIRKDHFCPFHNLTLNLKGLGVDGPKKTLAFPLLSGICRHLYMYSEAGKKLTLTIQLKNVFSPCRINEFD